MITRVKKMSTDYQSLLSSRYPNDFKKKVILYAEKHNNSEAERVFGIAESNVRRWRKIRSIIFSKGFVSETVKKKRFVRKPTQNNDDFLYEIEKVDMMSNTKKPILRDYGRSPNKSDSSPKAKVTTTPLSSPNVAASAPKKIKDEADEVCLRWNSHHSNMKTSFPTLLQREQYVDVTLTTEGKSLKCHRLILSSCSSYFDELLSGISPLQHPVIFLNGVSFWILKCLIDFMYAGEVHIEQNKLESLLKVAEMLQIKGLAGKASAEEEKVPPHRTQPIKIEKHVQEEKSLPVKREERQPPVLKKEEKIIVPKKEPTTFTTKSPIRKALSPTLISPIDPLSLLEPTFFEENPIPLKFKEHVKKVLPKKIKKRKLSEHVPSPPPILFRKGTKSRPHVKVPRYYHNDYEDIDGKKLLKKEDTLLSSSAPNITNLEKVKPENLNIEEVNVVQTVDKQKPKDNIETFIIKDTPEKKIESDEVNDDNFVNTIETIEIVEKEIKQENIDEDYVDLVNPLEHNLTI